MASPVLQGHPMNGVANHLSAQPSASPSQSSSHLASSVSPALSANNFNGPGHAGTQSHSPHPPGPPGPVPSQTAPQANGAPKQTPVPLPVLGNMNRMIPNTAMGGPSPVVSDVPAQGSSHPQAPAPKPTSSSGDSTGVDGIAKAQKFSDDYTRLTALIHECDPDAVRRAVRDSHERCLLGSQYHMAFILNVCLHRADDSLMQRSLQDFGPRLFALGKGDMLNSLKTEDLDEFADAILAKASMPFLDKAIVARLPSIEARRLVNALARAGRLGYNADDIVENEHVIPNATGGAPGMSSAPPPPAQPVRWAPPKGVPPNGVSLPSQSTVPLTNLSCTFCRRAFSASSAWTHHVKKRICLKEVTLMPNGDLLICPHCGQSFNGHAGITYHLLNKVCGDFGPVSKQSVQETVKPISGLNPAIKRPVPDSTPARTSYSQTPVPMMQTPQAGPSGSQVADSGEAPLGTPRSKDMSHLTSHQIDALKAELRLAETNFKAKIDHVRASGMDEADIEKKISSIRNSYACKQSTVRKKYGIRLRERRGRAEMDAERDRMGYGSAPRQAVPESSDGPAAKRSRVEGAEDVTMQQQQQQQQQQATPLKQVAVSDMGGGLVGSNATAATEDPTAFMSQPRSQPGPSSQMANHPSSSYQQGTHRVEVHMPSPSQRVVSSAPNPPQTASAGNSVTAKELLRRMRGATASEDDNSDSDSDSDSDSSTDDGNIEGSKMERP